VIRIFKEPLFHFLIIGLVIALLVRPSNEADNRIILNKETQARIAGDLGRSLARQPTEEELEDAYREWVEDEMIYREALSLGLDKNDSRIRKRLIDKYRSLLDIEVAEPAPEKIKQYYENHIGRYVNPRRYSLIVSKDSISEEGAFRPKLNEFQISSEFGKEVLEKLGNSEINDWIGPIEVDQDQIMIKLLQVLPPDTTAFEEARYFIPTTIKIESLRKAQSENLKAVKDSYDIVYE